MEEVPFDAGLRWPAHLPGGGCNHTVLFDQARCHYIEPVPRVLPLCPPLTSAVPLAVVLEEATGQAVLEVEEGGGWGGGRQEGQEAKRRGHLRMESTALLGRRKDINT